MENRDTASCKPEPGSVMPTIDRNRCEAKAQCVQVCPYGVFEVQPLRAEDRAGLSILGWIKAFVHGNRQAYVVRPESCHACRLCIEACPEDAIRLIPFPAPVSSPSG